MAIGTGKGVENQEGGVAEVVGVQKGGGEGYSCYAAYRTTSVGLYITF